MNLQPLSHTSIHCSAGHHAWPAPAAIAILFLALTLTACRSPFGDRESTTPPPGFVGTAAIVPDPTWLRGIDLSAISPDADNRFDHGTIDLLYRYGAQTALIPCSWSKLQPGGPGTPYHWELLRTTPALKSIPQPIALVDLAPTWTDSNSEQISHGQPPIGSSEFLAAFARECHELNLHRFILKLPADHSFASFAVMLPALSDAITKAVPMARVFVEVPTGLPPAGLNRIIPDPWPTSLQGIAVSLPPSSPDQGIALLTLTEYRAELEALGAPAPTIILQSGWNGQNTQDPSMPASQADEIAWRNGLRRLSSPRTGFHPDWLEAAFFTPTSPVPSALPQLARPHFCPTRFTVRSLDGRDLNQGLIQGETYRFQVAFENLSSFPITQLQLGLTADPESKSALQVRQVINPLIPVLGPGAKAMAEFSIVSTDPSELTLLQPFAQGRWDNQPLFDETWFPVRVDPALEGRIDPQRIVFAWPYVSQTFRLELISRDRSDHIEGGVRLAQSDRSNLMLVGTRTAMLPPRGGTLLDLRLVPPQNLQPGRYPVFIEGTFESLPDQRPIHFSRPLLAEAALPVPSAPRPIELDGELQDWSEVAAQPAHYPTLPEHESTATPNAELRFTWDEHALYLALKPEPQPNAPGFQSLAIAIDPEGNSPVLDQRRDDLLYEAIITGDRPMMLRLVAPAPLPTGATRFMGIGLGPDQSSPAPPLEIAIPWNELGHLPESGLLLPIAVQWIADDGRSPETLADPWSHQGRGWNHFLLQISSTP